MQQVRNPFLLCALGASVVFSAVSVGTDTAADQVAPVGAVAGRDRSVVGRDQQARRVSPTDGPVVRSYPILLQRHRGFGEIRRSTRP